MTALAEWTVNDILRNVPEAAPVLNRLGIDTCCGGSLTLEQAAESIGLTTEQVMARIRTATVAV